MAPLTNAIGAPGRDDALIAGPSMILSNPIDEPPRGRAANLAIYSGFVAAGVVTTLLGPILPILMARWAMTDERAGGFFTLQFLACLAGIVVLGPVVSRRGFAAALAMGFGCMALGMAALARGNEPVGMLATAAYGFGLGIILPGTNLWVAEISPHRRASALSVLNLAWGVGAIASAPLVLLAQRHNHLPLLLFGIAAFSLLIALAVVAIDIMAASQNGADAQADQAPPRVTKASLFALGALFFLYVGTENSVGGWTAALAKRTGPSPGNPWELAPWFFWGGLLAGRALTPRALLLFTERALLLTGITAAAASSASFLRVATFRGIALSSMVAGLGLACVYPLLVSGMVGHYGGQAKGKARIVFALASLGGATMPWSVGFASTHAHSLRVGFMIPFGACLVMIGLLVALPKLSAS
jgi:MFS transporter, FHS family, glucose/mannose:H+ symporter